MQYATFERKRNWLYTCTVSRSALSVPCRYQLICRIIGLWTRLMCCVTASTEGSCFEDCIMDVGHTATIMVKVILAAGKLSSIIYSTLDIGSLGHGATTFQQMLDQHSMELFFPEQHSKWHRNFLDHISKIAINCLHHIFKSSNTNLSGPTFYPLFCAMILQSPICRPLHVWFTYVLASHSYICIIPICIQNLTFDRKKW